MTICASRQNIAVSQTKRRRRARSAPRWAILPAQKSRPPSASSFARQARTSNGGFSIGSRMTSSLPEMADVATQQAVKLKPNVTSVLGHHILIFQFFLASFRNLCYACCCRSKIKGIPKGVRNPKARPTLPGRSSRPSRAKLRMSRTRRGRCGSSACSTVQGPCANDRRYGFGSAPAAAAPVDRPGKPAARH